MLHLSLHRWAAGVSPVRGRPERAGATGGQAVNKVVGLTGPIGSGKTTVARELKKVFLQKEPLTIVFRLPFAYVPKLYVAREFGVWLDKDEQDPIYAPFFAGLKRWRLESKSELREKVEEAIQTFFGEPRPYSEEVLDTLWRFYRERKDRDFIRTFTTDLFRAMDEDVWIREWGKLKGMLDAENVVFIVEDVRFPNETNVVDFLVFLEGEGSMDDAHESESYYPLLRRRADLILPRSLGPRERAEKIHNSFRHGKLEGKVRRSGEERAVH
ncbi:MAG: hypothetical protein GXO39_09275 [Thermotogae bacterium]|nr:hypothetical protein [Thermotogota bacterium]